MDEYRVLKVIGEGSFGRALLVQTQHENYKYVMKEIQLSKVKVIIRVDYKDQGEKLSSLPQ